MSIEAPEIHCKTVSANKTVGIDFSGELGPTELLIGAPVLTPKAGSDVTVSGVAVNTVAIENDGCFPIEIGRGVEALVSGGSPTRQAMLVEADTDGGQHVVFTILMDVVAD